MLNEERGAYGPRSVSLSVWRRGHSFLLEVPRGRIGYHGRDWNKVNSQIYFALMYHNTDEPIACLISPPSNKDNRRSFRY